MKKEITYWKGVNLGPQRKEWMKTHLRLEEIDTEPVSEISKAEYNAFEKDGEEVLESYAEFSFDHNSFITGYKSGRAAEQRQVYPPNKQ